MLHMKFTVFWPRYYLQEMKLWKHCAVLVAADDTDGGGRPALNQKVTRVLFKKKSLSASKL